MPHNLYFTQDCFGFCLKPHSFCLPSSSCWSLPVPAFVKPCLREGAFNQVEIPAVQPPALLHTGPLNENIVPK